MQTLLLLKGHPATGKSSLAQALARRLGWPLVDKDDVKDFTHHLPRGNFIAYDVAWRFVDRQLSLGLSVVVDTPLSYPIGYETGQKLADAHGARLLVVESVLPEDVWRQRLEARQPRAPGDHKIRGWPQMQTLLAEYDGCWQYPIDPTHHLWVDTSQPERELICAVLDRLNQPV